MRSTLTYKKLLLLFILLLGIPHISSGQELIIEGLLYLDNSPVSIKIKDEKIVSIEYIDSLTDKDHPVYIAPGLIDNQVNGFAGVSFGFTGGELTPEAIRKATQALWKKGVTSYLPTVTTNSIEILMNNLSLLAKAKKDKTLLGSIAGFHLEGPYISPIDGYRGAHLLKYIRKPDWNEFMALYEASDQGIITVTVAPEVEGAMDFIRKCSSLGIVVAIGHHNASKEMIDQAVLNGARISTHLGNGCANMINRHINPLWPQLANDELIASIICDGFHLRDEEIAVFYKVKGYEKIIITSDVTHFAALPPGIYITEENETIELTAKGKLYSPEQNVLYGSASPLSTGVVHIMHVTGCSLGNAIRMASTNPAQLYGLSDRGIITPGKRADLILFTLGERDLDIKKTYVAGKLVYEASEQ